MTRRRSAKPRLWTPAQTVQRLRPIHGPVDVPRQLDPLEELIFTILSQSTTDTNSERAFTALRKRFPDWEQLRRARVASITAAIRQAGLANQKAPRIKRILSELHKRHGIASLDHLEDMNDAEAVEYLTAFDGVGPKTAACVLLFACRRPVLPVDTHVHRVSGRLGLIGPRVTAHQAHDELGAMVAPRLVLDFHVLLIRHGRTTCKAQRPRCDDCVLRQRCPMGLAMPAQVRAKPRASKKAARKRAKEQPHVPPRG